MTTAITANDALRDRVKAHMPATARLWMLISHVSPRRMTAPTG